MNRNGLLKSKFSKREEYSVNPQVTFHVVNPKDSVIVQLVESIIQNDFLDLL